MKVIEKADIAPLEPMLCSVAAAVTMIGRCERSVIDLIAKGELTAVKSDRRTMVRIDSIRNYVNSLPTAVLKPANRGRHFA